jgi:hypothetical protein
MTAVPANRPVTGLLAWQAVVGQIRLQYELDSRLTLQVISADGVLSWSASVVWGNHGQKVSGRTTVAEALRDLWVVVESSQAIFESDIIRQRQPADYAESEWIDAETTTLLARFISLAQDTCGSNWDMILIYEPVESAGNRFNVSLLSDTLQTLLHGSGPTLLDACRVAYRETAQYYATVKARLHQNA